MRVFALRLHPNDDLKKELIKFAKENNVQAGLILTCVGSLKRATLRMANQKVTKDFKKRYEIVSLVGTISQSGTHLHVALSDENGNIIGGHVKEDCLVYTTAELVIGELEDLKFTRALDKQTGFKELVVSKK